MSVSRYEFTKKLETGQERFPVLGRKLRLLVLSTAAAALVKKSSCGRENL